MTGDEFNHCKTDLVRSGMGMAKVEYNKEEQDKLKDKTLLIRRDLLDKGVTEDMIKQSYPYPFKIVSKDEMDKYVLAGDAKYAYTWLNVFIPDFPDESSSTVKQILDAADGKQLAFSQKGDSGPSAIFFTIKDFIEFVKVQK